MKLSFLVICLILFVSIRGQNKIEVQQGSDTRITWNGKYLDYEIKFQQAFSQKPDVLISYKTLDNQQGFALAFETTLIQVTQTGFKYRVTALDPKWVGTIHIYWFAHTDPSIRIQYKHQVATPQLKNYSAGERSQDIQVNFDTAMNCKDGIVATAFLLGGRATARSQEMRVSVKSVDTQKAIIKTHALQGQVDWISFSVIAACDTSMETFTIGTQQSGTTLEWNKNRNRLLARTIPFSKKISNTDLITNGFIFQGISQYDLRDESANQRLSISHPILEKDEYSAQLTTWYDTQVEGYFVNGFVYVPQACTENCVKLNGLYYPRICLNQNFDLRAEVTKVEGQAAIDQVESEVDASIQLKALPGKARNSLTYDCFSDKLFDKNGEYTYKKQSTLERIDFSIKLDYVLDNCLLNKFTNVYTCEFTNVYYINKIVQYIIDIQVNLKINLTTKAATDLVIEAKNKEFNIEGETIEVGSIIELFESKKYDKPLTKPQFTLGDYIYAQVRLTKGFMGSEYNLKFMSSLLFSIDRKTEIPMYPVKEDLVIINGIAHLRLKLEALFAGSLRLSIKSQITQRIPDILYGGRRVLQSSYEKSTKLSSSDIEFGIVESKKDSKDKDDDNNLAIILIAVGCSLVVLGAAVGGIFYVLRMKKMKSLNNERRGSKYRRQESQDVNSQNQPQNCIQSENQLKSIEKMESNPNTERDEQKIDIKVPQSISENTVQGLQGHGIAKKSEI